MTPAEQAALSVVRRFLPRPTRAQEVTRGTHVLVRLEPGPIAARVSYDGGLTTFAGDLDAEVRTVAALHAAGAPVVPPLPGVPARVHLYEDRRVTLWTWWQQPSAEHGAQAAGRALAACHRALADGTPAAALEPWVGLSDIQARVDDLPARYRGLIEAHIRPPDAPLQPIHGDAHEGNVLPGPAWHDFEDVQLGCVEWDLACLVSRDRVLGRPDGRGEQILAGYDLPYDRTVLDHCVNARVAWQSGCALLLAPSLPGLLGRAQARLGWLAER